MPRVLERDHHVVCRGLGTTITRMSLNRSSWSKQYWGIPLTLLLPEEIHFDRDDHHDVFITLPRHRTDVPPGIAQERKGNGSLSAKISGPRTLVIVHPPGGESAADHE